MLFSRGGGVLKKICLPKALFLRAVVMGVFLQVGYQVAYFLAIYYMLTPGVLAILLGVQPILTPLFAREKIGSQGYIFLFLGLLGLGVAVVGAREVGAVTLLGLIFGIFSVLAISIGSVMQKKSTIDPVVSAFYQNLTASFVFLVTLPATQVYLTITPAFILSAVWMIFVVSTLAVVLLFYMLAKNSASKVGILFYMVPVITIFLDYVTFGHRVSGVTVAGALLVIVAVRGFGQVSKSQARGLSSLK
jgi:drug/metabolite transporter (DMT)-like permease